MNVKDNIEDAINIVRSKSIFQTVVIGSNAAAIKIRHDIKEQVYEEINNER